MKVLVYRKCSTCQKALKWLEAHEIAFEERAIVEENPTYEELKEWHAMSGFPLKKFFNTSGMLYKQMQLKDKLPTMTEDAGDRWYVGEKTVCSWGRICTDRV